jgi:excisionase family DNA binding protein
MEQIQLPLFSSAQYRVEPTGRPGEWTVKQRIVKPTIIPEVLKLSQAAALLGMSERTLQDLCQQGEIPAYRLSAKPMSPWRIRRADLEAYDKKRKPCL